MAKKAKIPKRKLTKAERREKYTQQARDRRQKATNKKYNANKICFNCRRKGHTVAECPNVLSYQSNGNNQQGFKKYNTICYKCGSNEHSLKNCPKLSPEEKQMSKQGRMDYHRMVLPFATCFICKEKGHLSSQCKQNENGVYVKGGCCKRCGSKTHLFVNCPIVKKENEKVEDDEKSAGDVEEFLEEDDAAIARGEGVDQNNGDGGKEKSKMKKKRKVVNF